MYNRLLRMGSEIVSRIRINRNKSLSTLYIDSPKTSLCENKASIAFMSMGKTKVPLEVSIREFFCVFFTNHGMQSHNITRGTKEILNSF